MRPVLTACLAALFALSLSPSAPAQSLDALLGAGKPKPAAAPVAHVDDAILDRDIEARLSRVPGLEGIVATVEGGIVRLQGEVVEPEQKQQARQIATAVPGVVRVDDAIALDASLRTRFASAYQQVVEKVLYLIARAPLLLIAALIVVLAAWVGGLLSRRLHWIRLRSSNPYMDGLVRRVVQTVFVVAGILLALDLLGATALVGAVLGSAGLIGLVLGFAFKDIAENYVSGILLSLRRPFAPGDTVVIEGREGKVVALTSRATVLMTPDGNHLQLPNALVFKSVILNTSRNPKRRFEFSTAISTHASWHDALELGVATLAGLDGVLDDPAPSAQIDSVSPDGATLRFTGWIDQRDNDLGKTRSEALRLVRRALRKAGIVPPEPVQRVQLVRGDGGIEDEALAHAENATERDTSVDRAVDGQLDAARVSEAGSDLLTGTPEADAPKSP